MEQGQEGVGQGGEQQVEDIRGEGEVVEEGQEQFEEGEGGKGDEEVEEVGESRIDFFDGLAFGSV